MPRRSTVADRRPGRARRAAGPRDRRAGLRVQRAPGESVAADDIDAAATGTAVSAITPGSVNRTSLNLTRDLLGRPDAELREPVVHGQQRRDDHEHVGRPDRPDRAQHDRRAARRDVAARRRRSTAGTWPAASSDQTIVVPLGGILAAGDTVDGPHRTTSRGCGARCRGSNWLFTKVNGIVDAYRWIPWVSRATPFNRPNHGDPFVTPVSPRWRSRVRTDRRLVVASTADRVSVSSDGLTQRFVARNVRDVTVTAAPDFRTATVLVGSTKVRYYYRSSANSGADRRCRGGRLPGDAVAPGPVSLPDLQGRPVGRRVRHGVAGADLDPVRRRQREPALPRRARDRPPVVLRTGRQRPGPPAVRRRGGWPTSSPATSPGRAGRAAARPGGSTARSTATPAACYYEIVYIQGGNLLNQARPRMGSTLFWSALKQYVADRRYRISNDPDAAQDARRRDARRPVDAVPAAVPGLLLRARR